MSEPSRSRVTITLGGTGQVVKKAGSSFTEPHPVVGSKRSVRDRLGNNLDSASQFNNKRLRGDGRTASGLDDIHLSRDDLRYKIMQKNKLKQSQNSQQNGVDLRNILSRPAQSSTNSISTRDKMPPPRIIPYMEPTDVKQPFTDPRDGARLMPVSRNSSQYLRDYRDLHLPDPREQSVGVAREGIQRIPPRLEDLKPLAERSSYSVLTNVNGLRAANTMTKVETGFDPYSPWTLESLRRRSPDEALPSSRSLHVNTRDEELMRRFAVRTQDGAKTSAYSSKDGLEFSRPVSSSSYLAKTTPVVQTQMKTMRPVVVGPVGVAPIPVPSNLPQRSSFLVEDHLTVESFLRSIGLEKYSIVFKAEEVDMYSLRRMDDNDLKEMGLPMGPRKKILLELQSLPKRQA